MTQEWDGTIGAESPGSLMFCGYITKTAPRALYWQLVPVPAVSKTFHFLLFQQKIIPAVSKSIFIIQSTVQPNTRYLDPNML